MITSLVTDMCAKLDQARRLRTSQSEIKLIEATLKELERIAAEARVLTASLRVCRARLDDNAVSTMLNVAAQVAQEIEASRQRFPNNRRENLPLNNAGRKLQDFRATLAEEWRKYAQLQLDPYVNLQRLVMYLPEVASSAPAIEQLIGALRNDIKTPPPSDAHLAAFDRRLSELGQRLDVVASLPDAVRIFLGKVVGRAATCADLSPEVLAWVAEGQRASAFAITFESRGSGRV